DDISVRYSLSSAVSSSGCIRSAVAVKSTMSEKKTVSFLRSVAISTALPAKMPRYSCGGGYFLIFFSQLERESLLCAHSLFNRPDKPGWLPCWGGKEEAAAAAEAEEEE